MKTHIGPGVSLSAIVIRACDKCQGKREIGKVCETCGNTEPAKVTDLGVIASHHKSRWERLKWNCWGFYMAQRRIRKLNREMLKASQGVA